MRHEDLAEQHLLKSVLFGVMRLSLSEPGLGPFWDLGFSAVAEEAQATACKHPQRLLMLWPALVTLPAVSEAAPLGRMCGHLQKLPCITNTPDRTCGSYHLRADIQRQKASLLT